ncbi:MAG TPA: hypothetical protein VML50_05550 [Anaeromyxobacter sp.]|nr:hypothetical protein [Anaeromyxobacter sp.]
MVRPRSLAPLALVLLAAGCGGLGSPDLAHGVVQGRIVGAATTTQLPASVYALGYPATKAAVQPDGSYRLTIPVEATAIVLYDGSATFDATGNMLSPGLAELVPVQVAGAGVVEVPDRHGAGDPSAAPRMLAAGGVLAGARATSGAVCQDPRFSVLGTDQEGVSPSAAGALPAVYLAPLPGGDYQLAVDLAGFRRQTVPITVSAGANASYGIDLSVDDGDQHRGCLSSGCEPGWTCGGDGHCSWGGGGTCGASCDPTAPACEAGLACAGSGPGTCQGPNGCAAWAAEWSDVCFQDADCGDLAGGSCAGGDAIHAGYCTAACGPVTPCPMGWTCGTTGVCRRPE